MVPQSLPFAGRANKLGAIDNQFWNRANHAVQKKELLGWYAKRTMFSGY